MGGLMPDFLDKTERLKRQVTCHGFELKHHGTCPFGCRRARDGQNRAGWPDLTNTPNLPIDAVLRLLASLHFHHRPDGKAPGLTSMLEASPNTDRRNTTMVPGRAQKRPGSP
jgi:hypothetical protein